MRIGIFAGTFDPFTAGHLDIVKRASGLFDEVHVLVARNPHKICMFDVDTRADMVAKALGELSVDGCSFKSCVWDGALLEYCRTVNSRYIIKGLRSAGDFEYERELALQTKYLAPEIETVFLAAEPNCSFISATYVRQIIKCGMDVGETVPDAVRKILENRNA